MSDFFARLAARARDPGDVVQPRVPSRFETPELRTPDAPGTSLDVATEHEPLRPSPSRSARGARADDGIATHASRPAAPPVAAEAPVSPATVDAQPAAQAPRELISRVAAVPADSPPAVVPAAVPDLAPAAAALRADRRVEPHAEPSPSHVVEPLVRRAPAPPAPVVEDPPRRQVARGRDEGIPERVVLPNTDRGVPDIPPVAARVLAAPAAPAIVPRVVRAAPERPAPPSLALATETTVHVSIGRIEVRATPQPAEQRRERVPSPVMSLGDYLNSRAERAR